MAQMDLLQIIRRVKDFRVVIQVILLQREMIIIQAVVEARVEEALVVQIILVRMGSSQMEEMVSRIPF